MKQIFTNKIIGIIFIIAGVLLVIVFIIRFNSPEDAWLCQNGQWVKHGNPSSAQPSTACREGEKKIDTKKQTEKKPNGTPLGILITDPNLRAQVTSPLLIKGSATAPNFDHNAIKFKIIDKDNKILGEGSSVPGDKQRDGSFAFEAKVEYKDAKAGMGFIMINDNPNFKFPIQF